MLDHKTHYTVCVALNEFLADTAVVYFKTHGFHWNVEGPHFYSLHRMFEKFYEELWKSTDEIAERIRALGEKTPSSYQDLLKNAAIKESETAPPSTMMVKILRDDYLALAKKAHEVGSIAEAQGDRVTTDLMTKNATFLEKAAWMLLSSATE
jgi:starvation-inducible DNA-binding protein